MSTATIVPKRGHRLSMTGILRSEHAKFWSLRSTWITLLYAAAMSIGMGLAVATGYDDDGATNEPSLVLNGTRFALVAIAILSVLFITGEYSTGSSRSTMAAVPKRTPVLLAKAAVFSAAVVVAFAPMVFAAFFITRPLVSGTDLEASLSDPGVARAVLATVIATVYSGLLALGLGELLRNAPAAIGVFMVVVLLLPDLVALVPWSWLQDTARYAPFNVVEPLLLVHPEAGAPAPLTSCLTMVCWLAVVLGSASILMRRRDV